MAENGVGDPRRQAVKPLGPFTQRLRANDRMAHLSDAALPTLAWWVFHKLKLYPSPAGAIEDVVRRGTDLLVICGQAEFSLFTKRSNWIVRRLERSGHCHFDVVQSMDHSLFNFAGRSALVDLLTAQVLTKVVPGFKPPDTNTSKEGTPTT
jgi:hypothetical protein